VRSGEGKEAGQKAALLARPPLHISSIAAACVTYELLEKHHGTFDSKFAEHQGKCDGVMGWQGKSSGHGEGGTCPQRARLWPAKTALNFALTSPHC